MSPDGSAEKLDPDRLDPKRQLEMLDGMGCPYPQCGGVLKRDSGEIRCGLCARTIVQFE